MLERTVREWPAASDVEDEKVRVMVYAVHANLSDETCREAARVIFCDHPLSFLVRPVITTLVSHVDGEVKRRAASGASRACRPASTSGGRP